MQVSICSTAEETPVDCPLLQRSFFRAEVQWRGRGRTLKLYPFKVSSNVHSLLSLTYCTFNHTISSWFVIFNRGEGNQLNKVILMLVALHKRNTTYYFERFLSNNVSKDRTYFLKSLIKDSVWHFIFILTVSDKQYYFHESHQKEHVCWYWVIPINGGSAITLYVLNISSWSLPLSFTTLFILIQITLPE